MTEDFLNALAELLRPVIRQVLTQELQGYNAGANDEAFISVDEASDLTGLSKQTIYARTAKTRVKEHGATMPFHKQGKKLYFRRSELLKWMGGE